MIDIRCCLVVGELSLKVCCLSCLLCKRTMPSQLMLFIIHFHFAASFKCSCIDCQINALQFVFSSPISFGLYDASQCLLYFRFPPTAFASRIRVDFELNFVLHMSKLKTLSSFTLVWSQMERWHATSEQELGICITQQVIVGTWLHSFANTNWVEYAELPPFCP